MRTKSILILESCFFLTGCGTLHISINYENAPPLSATPIATIASATPEPTSTPLPTPTQSATPSIAPIPTPDNRIVAVAAGRDHTCALAASGGVKCWGRNQFGQLGNGTMINTDVPSDVIGISDVRGITAGWGHTCALTAGGVKCWGFGLNGELGDGRNSTSSKPVDVQGLATGVIAVDAGDDHTCAVTADGKVKCWGYNAAGQLGDDTTSNRSVPVEAGGFASGVVSVAAGWGHTCALTAKGGAECWGDNEFGQLGYGKGSQILFDPADVSGLTYGVLKISAAGSGSCALLAGGSVSCWGNNKYGQLGDGTVEIQYTPVQAAGLTQGIRDVETGWNHSCAVLDAGELDCWGWNYYGQLGDGTKTTRVVPMRVQHLTDGVKDIALGWAHTCVATELGAVKCWGSNAYGQLGDGTRTDSAIPLAVVGLAPSAPTSTPSAIAAGTLAPSFPAGGALAISAGLMDTCALTTSHGMKCWGLNITGQLGNGSTLRSNLPSPVTGLSTGVKAIAAGEYHTCAITMDNVMQCWGSNQFGQLGGPEPGPDQLTPVHALKADGMGVIREMALGREHTCVVNTEGEVRCWGSDRYGQLGDGANPTRPGSVVGLDRDVQALTARDFSTCALTIGDRVKCWGVNGYGQLGDGTMSERDSPVSVRGLTSGVTAVSLSGDHACALMNSGGVKCWGDNRYGQLGDGTTTSSLTPVDVVGLIGDAVEIQTGDLFSCARMRSGRLMCWGLGPRLTDNGLPCSPKGACLKAVEIGMLRQPAVSIAIGSGYICVIVDTRDILCWGENTSGQLGNGTNQYQDWPVKVIGW